MVDVLTLGVLRVGKVGGTAYACSTRCVGTVYLSPNVLDTKSVMGPALER